MKRLFLLVVSLLVVGSFNNRNLQICDEDYLIPKSDTALQPKADFDDNYHNEQNVENHREFNFGMTHFFKNQSNFSAKNHSSCGFVSLIQVLSYYDTFFNDDIIPEQYERYLEATNVSDFTYNSPGVYRDDENISSNNYMNYCISTQYTNFQSYLTVTLNSVKGWMTPNTFHSSTHLNNYELILHNTNIPALHNITVSKMNITDENIIINSEQEAFKQFIKGNILRGNPVLVHLGKFNGDGAHAVVAYDIIGNEIYGNFGWSDYYTHVPLLSPTSYNFDYIYSAAVLELHSINHKHSNNYKLNNMSYCGCGYSKQHFTATSSDWNNIPPTFTWHKNTLETNETFVLNFNLGLNGPTIYTISTTCNQITISLNSWLVIRNYTSTYMYVILERLNSSDNELIYLIINDPYKNMQYLLFDENTITSSSEYLINNGISQSFAYEESYISFEGNGLLKEDDTLILSINETSAETSYLSFSYNYIYRLDLEYSLHSDFNLINLDIGLFIQYKTSNNDNWVTLINLMEYASNNMQLLKIIFPSPVTTVRLYLSPNINSNLSDKIIVGGLKIYAEN